MIIDLCLSTIAVGFVLQLVSIGFSLELIDRGPARQKDLKSRPGAIQRVTLRILIIIPCILYGITYCLGKLLTFIRTIGPEFEQGVNFLSATLKNAIDDIAKELGGADAATEKRESPETRNDVDIYIIKELIGEMQGAGEQNDELRVIEVDGEIPDQELNEIIKSSNLHNVNAGRCQLHADNIVERDYQAEVSRGSTLEAIQSEDKEKQSTEPQPGIFARKINYIMNAFRGFKRKGQVEDKVQQELSDLDETSDNRPMNETKENGEIKELETIAEETSERDGESYDGEPEDGESDVEVEEVMKCESANFVLDGFQAKMLYKEKRAAKYIEDEVDNRTLSSDLFVNQSRSSKVGEEREDFNHDLSDVEFRSSEDNSAYGCDFCQFLDQLDLDLMFEQ